MATIAMRSLRTGKNVQCSWQKAILPQVKQCEKKNFPSSEAFDFDSELKKRNVEMLVLLDDVLPMAPLELVAYLVFSHPKFGDTVMLHKICVSKAYRRRGIAKSILHSEMVKLEKRCSKIQLWVHKSNTAAMELYKSLDFEIVSEVDDYYGQGRTGTQLALRLWKS